MASSAVLCCALCMHDSEPTTAGDAASLPAIWALAVVAICKLHLALSLYRSTTSPSIPPLPLVSLLPLSRTHSLVFAHTRRAIAMEVTAATSPVLLGAHHAHGGVLLLPAETMKRRSCCYTRGNNNKQPIVSLLRRPTVWAVMARPHQGVAAPPPPARKRTAPPPVSETTTDAVTPPPPPPPPTVYRDNWFDKLAIGYLSRNLQEASGTVLLPATFTFFYLARRHRLWNNGRRLKASAYGRPWRRFHDCNWDSHIGTKLRQRFRRKLPCFYLETVRTYFPRARIQTCFSC